MSTSTPISLQATKSTTIPSSSSTLNIPQYHSDQPQISILQQLKSSPKIITSIGVTTAVAIGVGIGIWLTRKKMYREMYEQYRAKQGINNNDHNHKNKHLLQQNMNLSQTKSVNLALTNLNMRYEQITIPLDTNNNNKKQGQLKGYLIFANTKQRNPRRIITLFHSQHINIMDNLELIKNLLQSTLSHVFVVEYRYSVDNVHFSNDVGRVHGRRSQKSMKQDAVQITNKALQLAKFRNESLVIFGKDLGAMLGIYVCSLQQFRYQYKIKGLILQNCTSNSYHHKISTNFRILPQSMMDILYRIVTRDKWQSSENMTKLRVPTLLLIQQLKYRRAALMLYQKYQGMRRVYEADIDRNDEHGSYKINSTNYFMEINMFMNSLV